MPKFNVTISAVGNVVGQVQVEAKDETEAKLLALEEVEEDPNNVWNWEFDEDAVALYDFAPVDVKSIRGTGPRKKGRRKK
jgi:hypothetical protein